MIRRPLSTSRDVRLGPDIKIDIAECSALDWPGLSSDRDVQRPEWTDADLAQVDRHLALRGAVLSWLPLHLMI
jgi:hypothetical protein